MNKVILTALIIGTLVIILGILVYKKSMSSLGISDGNVLGVYILTKEPRFKLHLKSYTFANTNHSNNIVAQRYINNEPYENDFIIEKWKDSVYRAKYPETNEFSYFTIVNHDPIMIEQSTADGGLLWEKLLPCKLVEYDDEGLANP